jgi:hypothetical protein
MKLRHHRLRALVLGLRRIKLNPWPWKHRSSWALEALRAEADEWAMYAQLTPAPQPTQVAPD